jgi:TonB family protein
MREAPGPFNLAETEPPAADILLLIPPEPWFRVFAQNLRDMFRRPDPSPAIESAPAAFWPDVFVDRALPWRRFLQSCASHVLVLALVWAGSRFLALRPHPTSRPEFTHADVVYYAPSEYLPPLDTRPASPALARRSDPEYSAQPIISVPPEAENRSQTIVAPPRVQLKNDVALPNVVAWSDKPQLPIGPAPAVPASEITRLAPQMDRSVIAPPPAVRNEAQASRQTLNTPQPAVIAPPPAVETGSVRRLGDLNIGRSSVIAPAPQLALDAQRTLSPRNGTVGKRTPDVIAPPPALGSSGRSPSGGGMIALNLHPAVGAPPVPPAGNRRGTFAATPEGHRGASGTPGASAAGGKENGSGSGSEKKNSADLPSGLYVGKTTNATSPSVNPNLIAGVRPPRVSSRSLQPAGESKLAEEERAIFGNRKFYSLSLNMPNLNSGGGSWIIRFAPVDRDLSPRAMAARAASSGDTSSTDPSAADLSAPSATRKVDPAYPLELMKQNVGGTVILYGVIHADGTVGNVRVLRSVDQRLDQFASQAIAKWQFQPAMKDGAPVEVEATFWIPFHPATVSSNF